MRRFRKIHLRVGPKGPGRPGLLSRGWDEYCDGAGFPTAFGGEGRAGEFQTLRAADGILSFLGRPC